MDVSRAAGKGVTVPLSEEEQRILHEMEQKLYEHDRAFADRVSHGASRLHAPRAGRWSLLVLLAGFVLLLTTFRLSVVLGALGFFLMLGGLLLFARHLREATASSRPAPAPRVGARVARRGQAVRDRRAAGLAEELNQLRRRLRSRFGHRA